MSAPGASELVPGGFAKPLSMFISGTSGPLLKWFAFAVLAPYASRVYWTDIRLPGEILDPLDPMNLHVIPDESVHVLQPRELQPDEQEARRAEAATATVIRSDETPESLQRLLEFLRMPSHTQQRIAVTARANEVPILVSTNAHRMAGLYSEDRIAPYLQAIKDSGACIVALWADAPNSYESLFDVVLHVEGSGPVDWRSATARSVKGISSGPLASRKALRFEDVAPIAIVLEKSVRPSE